MLNLMVRTVTTGPGARKHVIYARITHTHTRVFPLINMKAFVNVLSCVPRCGPKCIKAGVYHSERNTDRRTDGSVRANRNCSTQLIKLITTCGIARTFFPPIGILHCQSINIPCIGCSENKFTFIPQKGTYQQAILLGYFKSFLSSGRLICVSGRVFPDYSKDRSAFSTPVVPQ